MATQRMAYFARGLDGLFMPEPPGWEFLPLVRSGTPEATWAANVFPAERILPYTLDDAERDPYPSTESVLLSERGDIAESLRARGVRFLLLSSPCSAAMEQWRNSHGLRFVAADFQLQVQLENKVWFDRFLDERELPRPRSAELTISESWEPLVQQFGRRRIVLQRADSLGGEGTYFLRSPEEIPRLIDERQLPAGEVCLVREFLAGEALGITVFVGEQDVALSAVRRQCYYPAAPGSSRRLFAGIQWVPQGKLSSAAIANIERVFLALGEHLRFPGPETPRNTGWKPLSRGFFGFANVDFLLDRTGQVWIIECNPRMSAATPQLFAVPELSGGVPVAERFLEGFSHRRLLAIRPTWSGFPATNFAGATLDLTTGEARPRQIRRSYRTGRYVDRDGDITFVDEDIQRPLGKDELLLFAYAAPRQTATDESTLATVLSAAPLYDSRGRFTSRGRRLLERFRFV